MNTRYKITRLDEQGNPYSPRKQGAGLGNLKYAVDTLAYLSVDGQTKPKLEFKLKV